MAMLAERRFRKRYNLMPKGKALYEDESRFGTKMLEKMGWKKGEGLGASSEGSKDFIRIRYKNDAFGLGFEHRDDQWTQHEESFTGLLKTLNNEEVDEKRNKENKGSNDNDEEIPLRVGFGFQDAAATEKSKSEGKKFKEKISGVSLEERSKQSKARVHYKKFTKGKDIAQYSEKDLANIFGKKAVGEGHVNDFYTNFGNMFGVVNEEEISNKQMNGTVNGSEDAVLNDSVTKKKKEKDQNKGMEQENEFQEKKQDIQMQTFTSNISVQDYFKIKMEAIRNKNTCVNNNCEMQLDNLNKSCNAEPKSEMKEKRKRKKEILDLQDSCLQEPVEKKSKKKKKNLEQEISSGNGIEKEAKVEEEAHYGKETEERKSELKALENGGLREPAEKKSKKIKNKTDQQKLLEDKVQVLNKDFVPEHDEKTSKKNKITTDQNNFPGNELDNESRSVKKVKTKLLGAAETTEFRPDETTSKVKGLEVVEKVMNLKENEIENSQIILDEIKPKKKKDKFKTKIECGLSNINNSEKKSKSEELDTETILVQESSDKKKKNKKEFNKVIEIFDSDEDKSANDEIQAVLKKKKSKKSKETVEGNLVLENPSKSTVSNPIANRVKPKTTKSKKKLSPSCKNFSKSDINPQENDLEELKKKYQAFNIYPISSFCAEKFRSISLNNFNGSSLPNIEGYGLSSDLQLDIYVNKTDQERITKLWRNVFNKYEQTGKPMKPYTKYIKETITARKTKQKAPKLYIKSWQRKNAFQIV